MAATEGGFAGWLQRRWYGKRPILWLLPLSGLFRGIAAVRRWAFRAGWLSSEKLPAPVIVVGNISVGGTGKTPVVLALVAWLQAQGYRPGVISRGYGGSAGDQPTRLGAASTAAEVGDEPLLIARRSGVPVAVCSDRVAAGRLLLDSGEVDVIVTDDGLQHYRLRRDVEIVVVDGQRGFGNGACLPAGPLREPLRRLESVQALLINGGGEVADNALPQWAFTLEPTAPRRVCDDAPSDLAEWAGKSVQAVAGIGNPQRFFNTLRALDIGVTEHPFPDHYAYQPQDFAALSGSLMMTEKDAVKCRAFAHEDCWYLPVQASLPADFFSGLLAELRR